MVFFLCSVNEGIKTECEWTKTLLIKLLISDLGENLLKFYNAYYYMYKCILFSDNKYEICLKKLIRLVSKQNLEIKILSNITIDYSSIYNLIASIISYTIIIYQMLFFVK